MILDCIVTISFGADLVLWLFELGLKCVGVCIWECFDNCVDVLVICVLVFCILCTLCLRCFVYLYLFLLFLSVSRVRTTATE
jgi:hypothetical protein